jgi:hypothetical protein
MKNLMLAAIGCALFASAAAAPPTGKPPVDVAAPQQAKTPSGNAGAAGATKGVASPKLLLRPAAAPDRGTAQRGGILANGTDFQGTDLQGLDSQGLENQGSDFQGTEAQGVQAQGVLSQGILSQGVEAQGVLTQGVEAQGVLSQGVEAQGVLSQGVDAQGVLPQGVDGQSIDAQAAATQAADAARQNAAARQPLPSLSHRLDTLSLQGEPLVDARVVEGELTVRKAPQVSLPRD